MQTPFEVLPYSIDALKRLLAKQSKPSIIDKKLHSTYFENYFDELKTKVILAEYDYVDRDFLEDYSGYYVRCFKKYDRKCTRLHFFGIEFTKSNFENLLMGQSSDISVEILQNFYYGFIVIKPLPRSIIGRTCLKTYTDDNGRRCYPTIHKYNISLFGISLTIDSLAFQEQDSVVAACATSALWSAFHRTGKIYHHHIPSPIDITKMASAIPTEFESRAFPNKGLTGRQMVHAIRAVGLEPMSVMANDERVLKNTCYAYLRGGIPIILCVSLCDMTTPTPTIIDRHAITVSGFSLGLPEAFPFGQYGFRLLSSRIDELYAHDDQVGPFARMIFDGITIDINGQKYNSMHTSWKGGEGLGPIGSARAIPIILYFPLYHKIRIPYSVIHDNMAFLNSIIEKLRNENKIKLNSSLNYDIYLTSINSLKKEILQSSRLSKDKKLHCLLEKMPRFIWRVTAIEGTNPVLEFLFDATDIEQGPLMPCIVEYDKNFTAVMSGVSKEMGLHPEYQAHPIWPIIEFFSK